MEMRPSIPRCKRKHEDLEEIRGSCRKFYVIDAEGLIAPWSVQRGEKGELKNEGLSCDVIENTYRKNVDVWVTCDVYEKKWS
jgi:hypothetical protein